MNGHITDELPRLLTGEASRDDVLDAAAHLRECADCQQELVSAVVAHASLTSAQRFAPEIVATIAHEVEPEPELPDLSGVFAQVRQEAASPVGRARRQVRRAPTRTMISAAAAVVVIGAGIGTYAALHSDSTSGQDVALSAFQHGTTSAKAKISDGHISLDAASLPKLAGMRYEVWLTNTARSQMQPIGWIGADGKASLTVPGDLVSRFSDIEVSVQSVAAPSYQYSNVSVLRGAYSD